MSDVPVIVTPLKTTWLNVVRYMRNLARRFSSSGACFPINLKNVVQLPEL